MARVFIIRFLCFFNIFFLQMLCGQSGEISAESKLGFPYIQNFSPKDYGSAHSQNWAITQDHRGVMYFANGSGILEYDGVFWRLITTDNRTIVRSLVTAKNGRIYTGGRNEIGYLAADASGQLNYVSLLSRVPPEIQDFRDVWQALDSKDGIYFRTSKCIFFWQYKTDLQPVHPEAGTFRYWQTENRFTRLFLIRDTLYVRERQAGLHKLNGDSLQLVAGGEKFANLGTYAMVPYPHSNRSKLTESGRQSLIFTRNEGIFLFDEETLKPFLPDSNIPDMFKTYRLGNGIELENNIVALGTGNRGLIITNKEGHLLKLIDKHAGLRDQAVRKIYPDKQGGLWLALNNGIARVEYPGVFSFYRNLPDFISHVTDFVRHKGQLYISGNYNVYRLSFSAGAPAIPGFHPIFDKSIKCWMMIDRKNTLLAATGLGTYHIQNGRPKLLNSADSRFMLPSRFHKNLVYVGLNEGLQILKELPDGTFETIVVTGLGNSEIRTVAEESETVLWLGVFHNGFLRIELPNIKALASKQERYSTESGFELQAKIERFDKGRGMPGGTGRAFFADNRVLLATNGGLRRYDAVQNRFFPDSSLGAVFTDRIRLITHIVEGESGNIWIKTTKDNIRETFAVTRNADGSYDADATPFKRIAEWGSVYAIYPDSVSNTVWFGGPEGIVRYTPDMKKDYAIDFPAIVRRVTALKNDSLIYAGTSADSNGIAVLDRPPAPHQIRFADNALRLEYAAPSYDDVQQNRYRYYLEGFDKKWSPWTEETQKEYTNLSEGSYIFQVQAKNVYDHISSAGQFSFTILPPWYRSWWAYLLYVFLMGATVYGYNRWRTTRLTAQNLVLESQVAERTEELAEKNLELVEMNEAKSRFFANISHEFRTPLTLILGQISSVLPNLEKSQNIKRLQMASRNATQLQRLINQLLDLSKFDAREMTLQASEQNIVPLLRHLTSTFDSLAHQRKIELVFKCEEENIPVYFEQDKLEMIMHNLLSNALKFTREGGAVMVSVISDFGLGISDLKDGGARSEERRAKSEARGAGSEALPGQGVKITVRDSGVGIPADRLPYIFDRFYQVDSSSTREYEGTGIGLALTRELVQIHGGGISAVSELGFGTTFTVALPLGKYHLKPEQITERKDTKREEREAKSKLLHIDHESSNVKNEPLTVGREPSTVTVLIVDDNADMRAYIAETLVSGYNIIQAGNGESGFKSAKEEIPDLIITDVMMPKVDGYELTRKLREDEVTSHIPIIMLTAKAAEQDKFQGLETGADAFLVKPFSTKELQIRVRKLIELRQKLREAQGKKAAIEPLEVEMSSLDQAFLEKLRTILEKNITNEDFTADHLAAEAGVGIRQLQRKLKSLTGYSPHQYIRSLRLQWAKQMLEKGAGNVTDAAFSIGYQTVSAFSKAFRAEFGVSPSDFLSSLEK